MPYSLAPVPPFGVPQVLSLAFWGGLWGIVFTLVEPWLNRAPGGPWVGGILFGMIVPTLVMWFVVMPLKGMQPADGFRFPRLLVSPVVNTLWGDRHGAVPRHHRQPALPAGIAAAAQQRPRPKQRRSTGKARSDEAPQNPA